MKSLDERQADRGFAVAAALLTLLVASTIGTTMAELARLEVVLARQRKATTAALAAVDACVEDAVASLPAGWEFTDVVAGSDGIAGTADDGILALASDCTGAADAAPGAASAARLLLEVEAVQGRGRRRLEAVAERQTEPGAPSLLWVTDGDNLGSVTGTLTLNGIDAGNAGTPPSMLAAPTMPEALDAWIAAQGSAVVATGGTRAPIWAVPPPLTALVARAAAAGAVGPDTGLANSPSRAWSQSRVGYASSLRGSPACRVRSGSERNPGTRCSSKGVHPSSHPPERSRLQMRCCRSRDAPCWSRCGTFDTPHLALKIGRFPADT
jgi:hypothetical protein